MRGLERRAGRRDPAASPSPQGGGGQTALLITAARFILRRQPSPLFLHLRPLVELSVLHDCEQAVLLLQHADIGDRITIDVTGIGQLMNIVQ